MYNWVNFPFIRITFFFILGIISCAFLPFQVSEDQLLAIVLSQGIVHLVLFLYSRKYRFYTLNGWVALSLFMLFLSLGYAITWYNTPKNDPLHSMHLRGEIEAYTGVVAEQPMRKDNSQRILLKIMEVKSDAKWLQKTGKVLLYIKNDSSKFTLSYGEKVVVLGTPQFISSPKNPDEFNYKQYIGFQGIYFNHFISTAEVARIKGDFGVPLIAYANRARNWCEQVITRFIPTARERAIALALIVGIKDHLDDDISRAYASAGAMHVLAVSGLHVGVIYWIISFVFKRYKKKKYGKWIFMVVALVALWGYAFVTGLSASVLRAVTMFSFVTIGVVSSRQSSIYNTLAVSAFVLLCYNPFFVMGVGFQLSFIAVFGIVYMQPLIYRWIFFQNKLLDKIWVITSVSIAAQIATAPLVVLYFHQLPTYFFVSNLFVIPGAFLILCTGIGLFVFSGIPFANEAIGGLLYKVIWVVNELVFQIQKIPYNTMDNIYLSTFQSWCIVAAIMAILGLMHFRRAYWLVLLVLPVLSFSLTRSERAYQNKVTTEIVFYAINNATAIDFIQGDEAFLVADSLLWANKDKLKFHIAPYRLRKGIPLHYHHLGMETTLPVGKQDFGIQWYAWHGKTIAIVSHNFKTALQNKVKVDFVYVPQMSKPLYLNIKNSFEYQQLVLKSYGGSLPPYIEEDTKVHDLSVSGALHFRL